MIDENKHLYIQLANSIKEKIDTGEYRSGMPIMSERKMSEAYGLNRMTVRKAISKLIDEGFLISIQGKGTFVSPRNKEILREKQISIIEDHIEQIISIANMSDISKNEVIELFTYLYEEE